MVAKLSPLLDNTSLHSTEQLLQLQSVILTMRRLQKTLQLPTAVYTLHVHTHVHTVQSDISQYRHYAIFIYYYNY